MADGTTFTRRCRPGQVLFGKRRAYQRKVAVAEFEAVVSGDIYVLAPKDTRRLLPELLPFLCLSERFFQHAVGTSAGSLSPRTNWSSLASFEFDLPPLDQQRRIAEILWKVDEMICFHLETLTAIRELLLSFRQNLGSPRLFGRNLRLIDNFCESDGWRILTGKEIVSAPITRGYTPTGAINTDTSEIPFIKVYNLCFDGDFDFQKEPTFIEASVHHGTLVRSQTLPGDVLINLTGPPMGKISVVPDTYPAWNINQAIARYRIGDSLLRDYFVIYLQSHWAQMWFDMRAKKTSGQKNITLQLAQDLPVPIPPRNEMEKFVSLYHDVVKTRNLLSTQIAADNLLSNSILDCISS